MPFGIEIMTILYWLVIGAVVGWLAGIIMKSKGTLLRNIIIGIIGAVVGGFIGSLLNIGGGLIVSLLIAVGGACLVIFIARKLKI